MTRYILSAVLAASVAASVSAQTPGVPVRHAASDPVDKLLKKWDKNNDGFIDQSEYVKDDKDAEKFKARDKDGDGKLAKDEIKAWVKEKADKKKAEREE